MKTPLTPQAGLACLLLSAVTIVAHSADFPGEQWSQATPREVGLDETKLNETRDYALTGGGSGCIIRHGQLVFTWGDQAQRYDLKSTTKSFGAAALGLAIKDGKLRLADKARSHHSTFGTPPDGNAATGWLDEITILHLASQTAGFDKKGEYVPLLFKPGTEWAYSDSGPNWLAECITLEYRRDLDELMFERLFTPLGIKRTDLVWRKNAYRPDLLEGVKRREFGSGISANVNAMARFGLLWLNGGQWKETQILPREFVDQVRTIIPGVPGLKVHVPEHYSQASNHYGLLWWNNADSTIKGLPADTYWTWGLFDSLIVVMPSLDMVVARAGQSWKRQPEADHYEVLKPFLLPIVAAATAAPPYPASKFIERMDLDWSTHRREAPGSDNWPTTWADDDRIYTAWGDGGGFGGTNSKGRVLLGVAHVEGDAGNYSGKNVWGGFEAEHPAQFDGKSYGILSVGGALYMWVAHQPNPHLEKCQLAVSHDHGATWKLADWTFHYADQLTIPTFLNFGRDYAGARDNYVYSYFIHPTWGPGRSPTGNYTFDVHRPGRVYLARVPKQSVLDRNRYEFFAGFEKDNSPKWSSNLSDKKPVFEDVNGVGWNLSVSYNAGLKRYLLATEHGETHAGCFGLFDAPQPWGPWTTVAYQSNFGEGHVEVSGFYWNFPTKWQSMDGRDFTLVFTGKNSNDSWNTVRGNFIRGTEAK